VNDGVMSLELALRVTASLALVGTLAFLPRALAKAAAAVAVEERRWWLAGVGAALLLRLVVPGALVEVFTGFGLLDGIALGDVPPKYGAGQGVLLGPLFAMCGASEQVVFSLHAVLGALSVGLCAALVGRWLGGGAAAAAWALASLPLLVWHDRSEAATAPAWWAMSVALVLAHGASGAVERVGAALAWAFAAHTRPEMLLAGLWLLPVLPGARGRGAWSGAAVAAALLLPQCLHVLGQFLVRSEGGDLPASELFVLKLPVMLVWLNLALWPHAFPVALTLAGGWAAWLGWRSGDAAVRGLLRWLLPGMAVLMAPAMVDPVVVSLPRLEAPALTLWAAAAAALVWRAWLAGASPDGQGGSRSGGGMRRRRWLAAGLLALSGLATLPWLYRRDNADDNTEFLRQAASLLEGKRGSVHLLSYDDLPLDKVSRHHPGWLFRLPRADLRLRALRELPPPGVAPRQPTWVLLDARCHARHRRHDEAAPATYDHPACAAVRRRTDLKPVWQTALANRGDVHFPWWPQQASLPCGLYALDK
jgi:hypothetical protein